MNANIVNALLCLHEGVRLKPYRCSAGFLTIGVGHNLEARGLTVDQVRRIFLDDLESVIADLDRSLPWWRHLSDCRQAVLVDMCFNLGLAGLLKFRHTLADLQAGDYAQAAAEMLNSSWARQVGGRAQRLSWIMLNDRLPDDVPDGPFKEV